VTKQSKLKLPRLTITLGQGQHKALETIAQRNHATRAFIIRYALERFISEHQKKDSLLDL